MKKTLCLLLSILLFGTIAAQQHLRDVDSLVNVCRQKVAQIDNQTLYRAYINGYEGYTMQFSRGEWFFKFTHPSIHVQ